ncbi:MAG: class I SAM-dependent methyltransferase [Phycisphaeraceae bacterium]|nr:MAG: class I SAM-dependent methyltransferase [Phycisphaeraceae bacterium]
MTDTSTRDERAIKVKGSGGRGLGEDLGAASGIRLRFPRPDLDLDQDEEWCEARIDGQWQRFRFHDYPEIFDVPGLYERLFHDELKCNSPNRVVGLLETVLRESNHSVNELRVLDVGAGNGIVGERLRKGGAAEVVGIDIIPEAKDAAERDRPSVYDEYLVADLTDLGGDEVKRLRDRRFNGMTTVAALGFGDIPADAFATAFNLVEENGWIAFNVKDSFLSGERSGGFDRLIDAMADEGVLEMHAYLRYLHRMSATGDRIYYVALIGRKKRSISAEMIAKADDPD